MTIRKMQTEPSNLHWTSSLVIAVTEKHLQLIISSQTTFTLVDQDKTTRFGSTWKVTSIWRQFWWPMKRFCIACDGQNPFINIKVVKPLRIWLLAIGRALWIVTSKLTSMLWRWYIQLFVWKPTTETCSATTDLLQKWKLFCLQTPTTTYSKVWTNMTQNAIQHVPPSSNQLTPIRKSMLILKGNVYQVVHTTEKKKSIKKT